MTSAFLGRQSLDEVKLVLREIEALDATDLHIVEADGFAGFGSLLLMVVDHGSVLRNVGVRKVESLLQAADLRVEAGLDLLLKLVEEEVTDRGPQQGLRSTFV